jgi:predicted NAD/FAD-binding protein
LNNPIFSGIITLALAAVTSWSAVAAEPMPGTLFPHPLSAPDQTRKMRSLTSVAGKRGVWRAEAYRLCHRHEGDRQVAIPGADLSDTPES